MAIDEQFAPVGSTPHSKEEKGRIYLPGGAVHIVEDGKAPEPEQPRSSAKPQSNVAVENKTYFSKDERFGVPDTSSLAAFVVNEILIPGPRSTRFRDQSKRTASPEAKPGSAAEGDTHSAHKAGPSTPPDNHIKPRRRSHRTLDNVMAATIILGTAIGGTAALTATKEQLKTIVDTTGKLPDDLLNPKSGGDFGKDIGVIAGTYSDIFSEDAKLAAMKLGREQGILSEARQEGFNAGARDESHVIREDSARFAATIKTKNGPLNVTSSTKGGNWER